MAGRTIFRPLRPSDRGKVKELHEDWFPVSYEDAFYDKLVNSDGHAPYFTMAAFVVEESYHGGDAQSVEPMHGQHMARTETMIGCISANIITEANCDEKDLLAYSLWDRKLAYILTLGVSKEFRRHGTASLLLKTLQEHLETFDRTCQAMYLHCLSTNYSALRFYERSAFRQVRVHVDFYFFDNCRHNAVTLVRYLNGGRPPWSVSSLAAAGIALPAHMVRGIWRRLTEFAGAGRRLLLRQAKQPQNLRGEAAAQTSLAAQHGSPADDLQPKFIVANV